MINAKDAKKKSEEKVKEIEARKIADATKFITNEIEPYVNKEMNRGGSQITRRFETRLTNCIDFDCVKTLIEKDGYECTCSTDKNINGHTSVVVKW